MEATTVHPSADSLVLDDSTYQGYFGHYVPIKVGRAPFSKRKKAFGRPSHQ